MTKIWVVPESAIASFDAIVIAAYAHFDSWRGANKGNAACWFGCGFSDSILVGDPVETFEVTTVMSSLSTITSWAGENI